MDRQRRDGLWQSIQRRREASDLLEATHNSNVFSRNKWAALLFGQGIAFIAASVNVTSFTLENHFKVVAPMSQLFVVYVFLSIHMCFRSPPQDDHHHPEEVFYEYKAWCWRLRLRIPWYIYFSMACVDVGASVIMLLSLQYTSLTSVTLLTSLTVPSTMLFSKLLLNKSFHCHHFLGVGLSLIGGFLTIWSDLEHKTNKLPAAGGGAFGVNVGDFMAITAALLYGLGDAVSEYSIKHIDRKEYMGMLSVFGAVLTGVQLPREWDTLSELFNDPAVHLGALSLMGGYVSSLLLYYLAQSFFLVSSDATLLNLSLQAQNLWAILFTVLAYQKSPPLLFYCAVVFVAVGVFAYEIGSPKSSSMMRLSESVREVVQRGSTECLPFERSIKHTHMRAQYSSIEQIEAV